MTKRKGAWGSVIEDKKRKRFRARYQNPHIPGKVVQRTFSDRTNAYAWLAQEKQLVDDDKAGRKTWTHPTEREEKKRENLEKETLTLERYASQKYSNFRQQDGSEPSPGYRRKINEYLRHLSMASFWEKPLTDITPEEVTEWKNNCNLQPTPRLRTWQELKKIMNWAVEEGHISKSPVTGKSPKIPPSKQAMIPTATSAELRIIYENMPEYSRISVYIAAIFDLRISEVLALQVKDVDLKKLILHVRHGLRRGKDDKGTLHVDATKTTSSIADQPIPQEMVSMLRVQINGRAADKQLIESPKTGDVLSQTTLRNQFDKAKVIAGRPDLHFHTLRATAIDTAARSGASFKEVQKYGRHSDLKTSVDRYQRATQQGQREIANNVAASILPHQRTREDIEKELDETRKHLIQLEAELQKFNGTTSPKSHG
ncbi:Site-specific recombinase XerD [Bifidobacterium bohemicum]|uniref:Phage integrase n=1 Tax=Bifidobacterium bohemicum DSM 22767 TaxID=1437606 RepID=A0A086ZDZ2_9BIFI|nr:site-specific integrase [Bifidobacterium bohemicum]KFI44742.1 phage integrase [Bifidobacterium bohemicum DSM 22767]SCC17584.1 Site-specific recombinase XerD [Bifidobacterium bohemicum]